MRFLFYCVLVFPVILSAQITAEQLNSRMTELSPEVREHLCLVVTELAGTDTGKFVLEHVSPELVFTARPMRALGQANNHNVITMESLRLNDSRTAKDTENAAKSKVCFTAEILCHELLHNAQFQTGFQNYPPDCSGYQCAVFEMLMEMQAKFTGEKEFSELQGTEKYRKNVKPKPGLFLVMQRQSENPEKNYLQTLWQNKNTTAEGKTMYREQIREVSGWNKIYAEQAFRNNYGRFLKETSASGSDFTAHLQKIIDFCKMPVTAEFIREHCSIQPIPHGLACFENGVKILELEAFSGGYRKRTFAGKTVKETEILFGK